LGLLRAGIGPQLENERYPKNFAAGLVAVGATLGIMIPPSLSFIIIGTMVGLPIITIFTAGILPGIFEAFGLSIVAYYLTRKNNWGIIEKETFSMGAVTKYSGRASGVLFTPFLILGGIYLGWVTPTEVAAVAAGYCLFIAYFVYGYLYSYPLWQVTYKRASEVHANRWSEVQE